jgi:hypothetical protein
MSTTIRRWWRYNGTLAQSRIKAAARQPLDHRSGRGQLWSSSTRRANRPCSTAPFGRQRAPYGAKLRWEASPAWGTAKDACPRGGRAKFPPAAQASAVGGRYGDLER